MDTSAAVVNGATLLRMHISSMLINAIHGLHQIESTAVLTLTMQQ